MTFTGKVEVIEGLRRPSHGGPHVYYDGVCSCGAREYADEIELMDEDIWKEARERTEL